MARRKISLSPAQVKRFWGRVSVGAPDECWEWQAQKNANGYGCVVIRHQWSVFAHRVAYTLEHGPFPADLNVLHRCDNPPCCNPAHLYLGTQKDNVRDMVERGRARHILPPPRFGSDSPVAKLDESKVRAIRDEYAQGKIKMSDLGRKHGISAASVCLIVNRKTWAHVP